jgi:Tfp pilus assembly protein PilF
MGELWFQVRLNNTNDQAVLARAYNDKNRRMFARFAQFQLDRNPHNARARTELGFIEWTDGHVDKALESFRTACNDDPAYDQPHYYMGVIYRTQNRLGDARAEFETAVRLNPKNSKAFGNLAFTFLGLGNLDRAERNVRQAILLDPTDQLARDTLEQILQARNTAKPRPNASR